jgi:hypothetical protein
MFADEVVAQPLLEGDTSILVQGKWLVSLRFRSDCKTIGASTGRVVEGPTPVVFTGKMRELSTNESVKRGLWERILSSIAAHPSAAAEWTELYICVDAGCDMARHNVEGIDSTNSTAGVQVKTPSEWSDYDGELRARNHQRLDRVNGEHATVANVPLGSSNVVDVEYHAVVDTQRRAHSLASNRVAAAFSNTWLGCGFILELWIKIVKKPVGAAVVVGESYLLRLSDQRYNGMCAQVLEKVGANGRCKVKLLCSPESAPIMVKSSALASAEDLEMCPVCLEPLCAFDAALLCGHRFHKSCIDNLRTKALADDEPGVECPMCRRWATDAKGVLDWKTTDPVHCIALLLGQCHVARQQERGVASSTEAAQQFAKRRLEALKRNDRIVADIVEPALEVMAAETPTLKAGTRARFPCYVARVLAVAMPGAGWKRALCAALEATWPGSQLWEKLEETLRVDLETRL